MVKWAAEGAGKCAFGTEYIATRGHASVAGDIMVSRKAHGTDAVNQGGTADNWFIRP